MRSRPNTKWIWPLAPGTSREFLFLGVFWVLALALALGVPGLATAGLAGVATALGLGWLFFLRDPERRTEAHPEDYLAPADGRVVAVRRTPQPLFLEGASLQVSIFLGVLDVHVNRAPMAGRVAFVRHEPGRFLQAFREEASRVNEHNWIGLEQGSRRALTKQVAGILARRIECWVGPGEVLKAGDRIGMIKLGSRVDLYVPEPATAHVREGDRVRAGVTVVARAGAEAPQ
jgi:phosphatidylserine decarboxylase